VQRDLAIAALELGLRAAPAVAMQPVLDGLAAMVARRHPGVFERLAPWAGASFVLAPTGVPRGFLLQLHAPPRPPRLSIVDVRRAHAAVAVLSGSLPMLCDLLEGRIDGDAAFFERQLRLEGDTSAIVALRNAIDGEEIDLMSDFLATLPPVLRPAAMIADTVGQHIAAVLGILPSTRQN
jgi:predicted lipid carrier protein YhbT